MNKHIGSSFRDYLEKRLTPEEIQDIHQQARKEVERLRNKRERKARKKIKQSTEKLYIHTPYILIL